VRNFCTVYGISHDDIINLIVKRANDWVSMAPEREGLDWFSSSDKMVFEMQIKK